MRRLSAEIPPREENGNVVVPWIGVIRLVVGVLPVTEAAQGVLRRAVLAGARRQKVRLLLAVLAAVRPHRVEANQLHLNAVADARVAEDVRHRGDEGEDVLLQGLAVRLPHRHVRDDHHLDGARLGDGASASNLRRM